MEISLRTSTLPGEASASAPISGGSEVETQHLEGSGPFRSFLVPLDHVPLQFVSGHGVTDSCTCDWNCLTWGQGCSCVHRTPAGLEHVYSLSTSARLSWCFADGVNDVPKVLQDTGSRVRTVFSLC